jgi:hypothetical protein
MVRCGHVLDRGAKRGKQSGESRLQTAPTAKRREPPYDCAVGTNSARVVGLRFAKRIHWKTACGIAVANCSYEHERGPLYVFTKRTPDLKIGIAPQARNRRVSSDSAFGLRPSATLPNKEGGPYVFLPNEPTGFEGVKIGLSICDGTGCGG